MIVKKKKCTSLCDVLKDVTPLGHNTHKPPIGRFARYVSGTDASGNQNSQYFTKSTTQKTINAATVNQYNPNEMKVDTKQTAFVNSSKEVRDKYDGEQ